MSQPREEPNETTPTMVSLPFTLRVTGPPLSPCNHIRFFSILSLTHSAVSVTLHSVVCTVWDCIPQRFFRENSKTGYWKRDYRKRDVWLPQPHRWSDWLPVYRLQSQKTRDLPDSLSWIAQRNKRSISLRFVYCEICLPTWHEPRPRKPSPQMLLERIIFP